MRSRVLYLTNGDVSLYEMESHRIREHLRFPFLTQSLNELEARLAEAQETPLMVLTNVIEEEFRLERLPHVGRFARNELHRRHSERCFRTTPFRQAMVVGRESEGRRDDRVLLSALTHPESIMAVMDRIERARVNLQAISSVALLSATLPKRVGIDEARLLLVSEGEGAGLRQSYFEGGELRFSRLSPLTPFTSAAEHSDFVADEIVRTHHHLQRAALIAADGPPLPIYLLGGGAPDAMVHARLLHDPFDLRALSIPLVCERLRIADPATTVALFVQLFIRDRRNRYATVRQLRCGRSMTLHAHARRVALWSSAALIAGTAWNCMQLLADDRLRVNAESALMPLQSAVSVPNGPTEHGTTAASPRQTVTRAEQLVAAPMRPEVALGTVGRALMAFPEFTLRRVQWSSSTAAALGISGGDTLEFPVDGAAPPDEGGIHHVVHLEGDVAVDHGDLRQMSRRFDQLVAALRGSAKVMTVVIVARPLHAAEAITGSTGVDRDSAMEARFALQVVVRP